MIPTSFTKNYLELVSEKDIVTPDSGSKTVGVGISVVLSVFLLTSLRKIVRNNKNSLKKEILPAVVSSFLFTSGLAISGMIQLSRVQGYLNVLVPFKKWDRTLNLVLGCGVLTSFLAYQVKGGMTSPLLCDSDEDNNECNFNSIPSNAGAKITKRLIIGSALFGSK